MINYHFDTLKLWRQEAGGERGISGRGQNEMAWFKWRPLKLPGDFFKILNAKDRWIKVLKQSHFSLEIVLHTTQHQAYLFKIRCEQIRTMCKICCKHQRKLMWAMIMANVPETIPSWKRKQKNCKCTQMVSCLRLTFSDVALTCTIEKATRIQRHVTTEHFSVFFPPLINIRELAARETRRQGLR